MAELRATAWRLPTVSAKRASNSFVRGLVVSQPESRTSRTASRSSAVIDGRANGGNSVAVAAGVRLTYER